MAFALLLLVRCTNMGMSDYNPDPGSASNITTNQGGAGLQAPIWSDDPSKKTLTNQQNQSQ
ncbi:MAG TPA: hypothetical protein VHY09_00795 [Candidatus Methylacidiphilales bacterium]|nr:hypothetical protein [Candidatus Methylacidiphilales bacterium]